MYWRQALLSALLAGAVSFQIYSNGRTLLAAVGGGIATYVVLRVVIATFFRTRYWLSRGGHQNDSRSCPSCGQYIRRQSGDWILHCKRCGWTSGYPVLRWFHRSIPVVQFRRSLGGGRLLLLVLGLVLVVTAPTMGVLSFGDGFELGDELSGPTDTDGDGLNDKVEAAGDIDGYPLPQADQDHKDLYVRVYVGNGIEPLTAQEKRDLREIWAEMPVSNPNGAEGIDLHITQIQLSESITANLDNESLRDQEVEIYQQRVPEAAQCSVYSVVLVNVAGDPAISGRGASPGYIAIVDGDETQRYNSKYTVRTSTITHELLHNTVGRFEDGSIHTSEGWLTGNPGEHGTQFHMSDKTASHLSENGFAKSDYFEEEVCK